MSKKSTLLATDAPFMILFCVKQQVKVGCVSFWSFLLLLFLRDWCYVKCALLLQFNASIISSA